MFKKIAIVIVVLLAALLLFAATNPDTFRVQRATSIKATFKLDYVKPFEAHNIVEITLEAEGDSTNVTWTTHGPNPYSTMVIGLFFNMEHMLGGMFEEGLANVKTIAEK